MFSAFDRPKNLPDAIARQIRLRIIAGDFTEGQKLPTEFALSESFQVSRNVVREAIARLKLNGLIETRRGSGSFVADNARQKKFEVFSDELVGLDQLLQISQLRIEIESGAAALAAEHRSSEQLGILKDCLLAADQSGGDWERGSDAAMNFHLAVTKCSNNLYFIRLMEHLSYVIDGALRTIRQSSTGTSRIDAIETEHHAIFDAIERGDAEMARHAMRAHLINGMTRYSQIKTKEGNE